MEKSIVNENKILEIFSDELRNKKSLLKSNNKNKNDLPTLILSRIEESIELANNLNQNRINIINSNPHKEITSGKKINYLKEQQLKNLQKSVLGIDKVENYSLKLNKQNNNNKNYNVASRIQNNRLIVPHENSVNRESKVSVNSYYAEFLKKIKDDYGSDSQEQKQTKAKMTNSNIISQKNNKKDEELYDKLKRTLIVKGNVLENIIRQCVKETQQEKLLNSTKHEKFHKIEKSLDKTDKNIQRHKKKRNSRRYTKINDKRFINEKKKNILKFEDDSDEKHKTRYRNSVKYSIKSIDSLVNDDEEKEEKEKSKKRRKKSKCFRSVVFKGVDKLIFPQSKEKNMHKIKESILKKKSPFSKYSSKHKELIKNKVVNNSDINDCSNDNIHKRNKNNKNIQNSKNIEKNSISFDNNENNHFHKKHKNKKEYEKNSEDSISNNVKRNSSSNITLSSNQEFEIESNNNNKLKKSNVSRSIIQKAIHLDLNMPENNLNNNQNNEHIERNRSTQQNINSVKNKLQKHKEKSKKSNKDTSNNEIKFNYNSNSNIHIINNNYNNITKSNNSIKNNIIVKNNNIITYKINKTNNFVINSPKNINVHNNNNNNFIIQPTKFNIVKPENLITFEYKPTKKGNESTKDEISKKESGKRWSNDKDNNSSSSHGKKKRKIFCCL